MAIPPDFPIPLAPNRMGWPWTEFSTPEFASLADCPPISIVTPSYNQAAYLEATIRSVLLQGYPNLEYIIIDGGSTDESVAIIEYYQDWIDYWVSEADEGQSEAINKGFSRAQGVVLGWVNSDDLLLPGALAIAANAFQQQPDLGLFYGNAEIIDAEGQHTRDYKDFRPYDFDTLLHDDNIIPQPAAFFSAVAWKTSGPLVNDLHFVMDWDLWIKMARDYAVTSTPTPLCQVRIYPEAKSPSGGLERHLETYHMLLAHGSHAARIHYKIGLWYYEHDQFAEARRYFVEGLRRNPPSDVRKHLNSLLFKSLLGSKIVNFGRSLRSRR
jgi:glycosyltransferase involved in cell wall biosynthesis